MEKDYPRPMEEVWNATLAACKDMNLKIASQQYGAHGIQDRGGGASRTPTSRFN